MELMGVREGIIYGASGKGGKITDFFAIISVFRIVEISNPHLNFRRKKDRGAFLVTLLSAIVSRKVRILKGEGPLGQDYHKGKHRRTQEH